MGLCYSEPSYDSDYEVPSELLRDSFLRDSFSNRRGKAGKYYIPAESIIPARSIIPAGSGAGSAESSESKDVSEWSKRELKSYCWKNGLGTWGNKEELLARVEQHLAGGGCTAREEEPEEQEEEQEEDQHQQSQGQGQWPAQQCRAQQAQRWQQQQAQERRAQQAQQQQAEQLRRAQAEQQHRWQQAQERRAQQAQQQQAEQLRRAQAEQQHRWQQEQERRAQQAQRQQAEQLRRAQAEQQRRWQQEQEHRRQEEQRRLAQLPRCFVCSQRMESCATDEPWGDQCCPQHWSDGTERCTSCRRFIPRTERYLVLDAGRKACCRCFGKLVMTHQDAQPLYKVVMRFYASQGMQLRQLAVLVLDSSHMAGRTGDALRRYGIWSGTAAGLCETVGVSTIRTINYVQQTANGPRLVYRQQQLGPQVLQARTIFLRYGLSRLEAGRVLAHELMHVCLKDGLVAGRPLPPWMEEGMCELASYLWLETQLKQGALSPQGRVLCKILMEEMHTNSTPVYGNGFRAAYRTWTGMRWQGLRHMVEYVRQHGGFPG